MKKYFNFSWLIFVIIYIITFFITLACTITVTDEYDGNLPWAEAWSYLIYYFAFPVMTIVDVLVDGTYSSDSNVYFVVGFLFNLILNGLFTTILLNQIFVWLKKSFLDIFDKKLLP